MLMKLHFLHLKKYGKICSSKFIIVYGNSRFKNKIILKRDECEASKMSAESLIYTDSNIDIAEGNPMSIDLKVGDICLLPGDSRTYRIDEHGIKVKPRQSVVIYSREKFVLPLNVFGLVTGKGTYIFQGCIVASGK